MKNTAFTVSPCPTILTPFLFTLFPSSLYSFAFNSAVFLSALNHQPVPTAFIVPYFSNCSSIPAPRIHHAARSDRNLSARYRRCVLLTASYIPYFSISIYPFQCNLIPSSVQRVNFIVASLLLTTS